MAEAPAQPYPHSLTRWEEFVYFFAWPLHAEASIWFLHTQHVNDYNEYLEALASIDDHTAIEPLHAPIKAAIFQKISRRLY